MKPSLSQQCLQAVRNRQLSLGLEGLGETSIVVRRFPWLTSELPNPSCLICPAAEVLQNATNESDDYGYGVQVSFVQASNRSLVVDTAVERLLAWRERSETAYHNEKLPGVPEVYQCTVEPGAVIDPNAFAANYDATSFVVRCWVRRNRKGDL